MAGGSYLQPSSFAGAAMPCRQGEIPIFESKTGERLIPVRTFIANYKRMGIWVWKTLVLSLPSALSCAGLRGQVSSARGRLLSS